MKVLTIVAVVLAAFVVGCSKPASTDGPPPKEEVEEQAPAVQGQLPAIQKQLTALLKSESDTFLTIQEVGGDAMIQITDSGETLSLNIAYYPSKEDPLTALSAAGITLPETWKQTDFEADSYVQYDVPAEEAKDLPLFIHDLFTKFFKRSPDYKVDCYIEKF